MVLITETTMNHRRFTVKSSTPFIYVALGLFEGLMVSKRHLQFAEVFCWVLSHQHISITSISITIHLECCDGQSGFFVNNDKKYGESDTILYINIKAFLFRQHVRKIY